MATKGTPRQMLAAMSERRAFHGSPRKSMYWLMSPIFVRVQDRIENCASYSHQKAMAESAVGTMKGSSTMERKNDLKGRLRLSSIASHRPRANLMTLATTV